MINDLHYMIYIDLSVLNIFDSNGHKYITGPKYQAFKSIFHILWIFLILALLSSIHNRYTYISDVKSTAK